MDAIETLREKLAFAEGQVEALIARCVGKDAEFDLERAMFKRKIRALEIELKEAKRVA